MTTRWIDAQVEVDVEDILMDMDDEDLMEELRRRGVTVLPARERLDILLKEIEVAHREDDEAHFRILIDRIRDLHA